MAVFLQQMAHLTAARTVLGLCLVCVLGRLASGGLLRNRQ